MAGAADGDDREGGRKLRELSYPDDLEEEYERLERIEQCLEELVELKLLKDSMGATPEYERRKLIAWRNAFRACYRHEEPKP